MDFNSEIFVERLNIIMKEHPVTFVAIANELGMSRSALSQMRRGDIFPSVKTLFAIAKYFDISLNWLLGLSDKKDLV